MVYALDDIVYVTGGKHKGRIGLYKGSKEDAHFLHFFNCKAVVYKGYVQAANEKQKSVYLKRANEVTSVTVDLSTTKLGMPQSERTDSSKPNLTNVPRQAAPVEIPVNTGVTHSEESSNGLQ